MSTEKTVPMKLFITVVIAVFIMASGGGLLISGLRPITEKQLNQVSNEMLEKEYTARKIPITEEQLRLVSDEMLEKEYTKRNGDITRRIMGDPEKMKKTFKELEKENEKIYKGGGF